MFCVLGYAAIPAGGGGTFLGGYLVKKFDLHVKGIVRLCLGLTISVLLLMLVFLVSCGNNSFAGVNVEYGNTAENRFVENWLFVLCLIIMFDYFPFLFRGQDFGHDCISS